MSYQSSTFKSTENAGNFVQTSSRVVTSTMYYFTDEDQEQETTIKKIWLNPDFNMRAFPMKASSSQVFLTSLTSEISKISSSSSNPIGSKKETDFLWEAIREKSSRRDSSSFRQKLTDLWSAKSMQEPMIQLEEYWIMTSSSMKKKIKLLNFRRKFRTFRTNWGNLAREKES